MVKALLIYLDTICNEIIFHFVDEKRISHLHKQFFQDPTPTDCITFPIDDKEEQTYRILGEVFICTDVAISYATDHHLNVYEELTLYIIHGLLHLLGYDDLTKDQRMIMKKKEKQCMQFLKRENLILAS